jgi:uncharacterized protein (TIGR00159 family)
MTQYLFHWVVAIVDVVIVSFLIYQILLLIRGTRAVQVLLGLVFLFGTFILSERLGLMTLHWILNNFLSSLVLVVIILFQQDIRRGLARFGKTPFFSRGGAIEEIGHIEDIVKACVSLCSRRIGGLIVLEREIGLNEYLEIGTALDAKVSREVIVSIFQPTSPLHDGAIIIQRGRITAAGCFLPLSGSPDVDRDLGTRHRAAIGLTEETDAVVIVISEEGGSISLVTGGKITRDLDANSLRQILQGLFLGKKREVA